MWHTLRQLDLFWYVWFLAKLGISEKKDNNYVTTLPLNDVALKPQHVYFILP